MTAACVGGSTSKLFSSFSDREKQINLVQQTQKNTNKGKVYFFSFFSESSSPANKMRTSFLQLGNSNIFFIFLFFLKQFFWFKNRMDTFKFFNRLLFGLKVCINCTKDLKLLLPTNRRSKVFLASPHWWKFSWSGKAVIAKVAFDIDPTSSWVISHCTLGFYQLPCWTCCRNFDTAMQNQKYYFRETR